MKNLTTKILPASVPALGIVGLLLRLWLLLGGRDESGMLKAGHPGGVLCLILSVLVVAWIFWATRPMKEATNYRFNFPASIPGGIGMACGALAIAISSVSAMVAEAQELDLICAIAGAVAAVLVGYCAWCRFQGHRPNPLALTLVSVYLMLRLISYYRHWSSDPFLEDYCYQLLASVCLMLAVFNRACFCARIGKRHSYAFFALCAVYFSYLSLTGLEDILFYMPMSIWMIADLCRLEPYKLEGAQ